MSSAKNKTTLRVTNTLVPAIVAGQVKCLITSKKIEAGEEIILFTGSATAKKGTFGTVKITAVEPVKFDNENQTVTIQDGAKLHVERFATDAGYKNAGELFAAFENFTGYIIHWQEITR